MKVPFNFLQSAVESTVFTLLMYLLVGALVFYIVWRVLKNRWRWRRIQPKSEDKKHFFRHDVLYSIGSVVMAGFLSALILYLDELGYMKLYWEYDSYTPVWAVFQLFFLIFFYDTYFYWTHRMMHQPGIYRWVHKTHHRSSDPSPLTVFAFHPLENLIEFIPFLILPMFIPIYWPVLIFWQILDLLNNLIAHLGYEIYPKKLLKIPLLNLKTASIHHNMHHEKFNGNYGLYFTLWDKIMKTEFTDYRSRFEEIYERKVNASKPQKL
jgi:sterol desaturase/sphingolipid hydroxylase (fatty acid hydroxylase superfamily)